jgi:pimeloyl-ACP methyl ester carboxylesterase
MFEAVEFSSEGAVLRGRLYRPATDGSPPIVVMANGTSATISMSADRYAERFRAAGFSVLLYDHRNLGASDGEPRFEVNPWIQARGYRDAITFAETLPAVDASRLVLWGVSFSGKEVLVAAAIDGRPATVIAQIPACGKEPAPVDDDGSIARRLREALSSGDVSGDADDVKGPMPVVSHDQLNVESLLEPPQAFRWFTDYGGRFGAGWTNVVRLVEPRSLPPFHPGLVAGDLDMPVLMLVAPEDEMPGANPAVSRGVFDAIPEPKELVEMDGGHFGLLYHPGELFDEASRLECDFLDRMLR